MAETETKKPRAKRPALATPQMAELPERVGILEAKLEYTNEKLDDLKVDVKDMHDCLDRTRDQLDAKLEIMLDEFGASGARPFIKALNDAYELAIPNLTELFPAGRTAVVFDSSGSMSEFIQLANRKQGSEAAIAKAALIAGGVDVTEANFTAI